MRSKPSKEDSSDDRSTPARPRKPLGKALRLTPEEIAAAAEIKPEDIAPASAFFRSAASEPFKTLLDAEPSDSSDE